MSVSMWIYLINVCGSISIMSAMIFVFSGMITPFAICIFYNNRTDEFSKNILILLCILTLTFGLLTNVIPSKSTMQKMFIAEKLHADKLVPMVSDCVEKATRYVLDVIPCVKSMEVEQTK